jgi:hypothetical protein
VVRAVRFSTNVIGLLCSCLVYASCEAAGPEVRAVLELSERSLRTVSRADLQMARQTCLQEIEKYRRSLGAGPGSKGAN